MKKAYKLLLSAVLCVLIAVSSVPFASALSKPSAPSKVLYRSDYAVEEHCLIITPKSSSTGLQVQVINAYGKNTLNKYYKIGAYNKTFYKLDKEYIIWNFNKYISNGQFYTVRVRAFNASNYRSGKPNGSAKYSGWTSTYAAETVTGSKAVRVDNNNVKISWNKTKGATCYTLRFAFVDIFSVNKSITTNKTSVTLSKIDGVFLKKAKKITLEIVPVKLKKYSYKGADWKYHNLKIK